MASKDTLTPAEIRDRAEQIRDELDGLLARRAFAPRPNARQWRFLRHCLDVLLSGEESDFECSKDAAAQYRYEVDNRLSRYYGRTAPPVKYAFSLRHISSALKDGQVDETYPQSNGYVLVVSDIKSRYQGKPERETEQLIKAVVGNAVDAEFAAYRALPKIDLTGVEKFFTKDGPAYTRIKMYLEEHARRGWIISNRGNPSTKLLMEVRDVKMASDNAQVRTKEYWYLRWWSRKKRKYMPPYNEENFQTYVLVKEDDQWLVDHNIYPPPRLSAARRKWTS